MAAAKKKAKKSVSVKSLSRPTQRKALADAVEALGSQGKLAKKLDCSQQSVSAWLKGDVPRPSMQRKMKRVLNIPEPWL